MSPVTYVDLLALQLGAVLAQALAIALAPIGARSDTALSSAASLVP
jgi:hypothetical protein